MRLMSEPKPKKGKRTGPDETPTPLPPPEKPNRNGQALNVWLPDEIINALERFREAQRVKPSKTDTVEVALTEFLTREGFPPFPNPAGKPEREQR